MSTLKLKLLSFSYTKDTFIAAAVASIAATLCAYLSTPPWVMFIGWVAYFARPGSFSGAMSAALCVSLGLLLGTLGVFSLKLILPSLGVIAFMPIVFSIAVLALSFREVPIFGHVIAWFLGLITCFSLHLDITLEGLTTPILTMIFGVFSGFVAQKMQTKSVRNLEY